MLIVVTTFHVIACVVLVLSVLLQAGKGADMGAVFGGASTTIFGSGGAGNFLTRITTVAAVIFMMTSLTLTYGPQRTGSSSVMPESVAIPGAAAPAADGAFDDAAAPPLDAAPAADTDPAPAPVAAAPDSAPAPDAPAAAAPPAEAPAAAAAADNGGEAPAADSGGEAPPAAP